MSDSLRPQLQTAPGGVGDRVTLAQRYRLEREIGRGGMSVVHLATDLRYPRPVAVKMIDRADTSAESVDRFLREVEIVSALQHPLILPLYDSGEAGSRLYFVTPYVPGGSLGDRMAREGQLPIADAVCLACEVAGALAFAHEHGVVHRDVKPANILLWAAHATLADFGIGKARTPAGAAARPRITLDGGLVGTPAYVSPEQGAGESELDGRSDLYSLGCVLYEMLAGAPPFVGPTAMAVIARRFVDDAPPLGDMRAGLPAGLEEVIGRTLQREPADRYQTAAALAEALAPFTGGASSGAAAAAHREEREPVPAGGARTRGNSTSFAAPAAAPAVAVIPFTNVGADPNDEYLADGLTDEIIGGLSRLRTIRVTARTSAFALKGTTDDARTIGARFGVDVLLEGSVRRAANQVRVLAQLVGAHDGYQIWSERYDRPLDDVLAIQEEIARSITGALEASLLGADADAPVAGGTDSVAAYDAFLRGRHWAGRRTEEHVRRGIAAYEEALRHDARFARAHAGLSDALSVLAIYGYAAPIDVMPRARDAAERARSLDPALADAHASLGRILGIHDRDAVGAERAFRRALTLNPRYPTAHHWYAIDYLLPRGRFAEAVAEIEQARAIDPLSPLLAASLGLPWYFARQYDAAIDAYRRALVLDPGFGATHFFLGQALVQAGRAHEALDALAVAAEITGRTAEVRGAIGYTHAMAGDHATARALLDELRTPPAGQYVSPCLPAQIHAALGETDRALECLTRACAQQAVDVIWLPVRPTFDALRDTPGFIALLERDGTPAASHVS